MSLFGSGAQPFSSNAQAQAKTGPSFGTPNQQQLSSPFAQPATGQLQSSGNTFGTASSSQPQPGTSLFGNTTATPQPAQNSTANGFFALNSNQSAGLFGGVQARPIQQPGNSHFGTSQSQQLGGLFGNTQTQSSSLFGSKAADSSKPSLFGLSAAAVQPNLSLPGGTTNNGQMQQQNQSSSLAGFSLGQASRQQHMIPGVRIDASSMRNTTRFNDLHEEMQTQIERVDAFIQHQIQLKEQCDAMMPSHESRLGTIPEDVALVDGIVDVSELGILNDSASIKSAKDLLQSDADTARISFRAIETLKLPSQLRSQNTWYSNAPRRDIKPSIDSHSSGEPQPEDVVGYFAAEAGKMTGTLHTYEKYLSEIEGHLQNVESNTFQVSKRTQLALGRNGSGQSVDDQIRELAAVLKEFEGGIHGIAIKIGDLQDETQKFMVQPKRRDKGV